MCLIFFLSSILSYLFPKINGNPFKKQLGSDCILSAWVGRFEKDCSFQPSIPTALLLALPRLLMIGTVSTWELRKSDPQRTLFWEIKTSCACDGCFFWSIWFTELLIQYSQLYQILVKKTHLRLVFLTLEYDVLKQYSVVLIRFSVN